MLAVFILVTEEVLGVFFNIFAAEFFLFTSFLFISKSVTKHAEMQSLSQRVYGLTGLINPVRAVNKKGRQVGKKTSISTKVTNQGHAHVFICIVLWNIILAIFLIFCLKITSMTTKTGRSFSNSKFNNDYITHQKYTPSPGLLLPFMLQLPLLPGSGG